MCALPEPQRSVHRPGLVRQAALPLIFSDIANAGDRREQDKSQQ
jgi:hypothetical protein